MALLSSVLRAATACQALAVRRLPAIGAALAIVILTGAAASLWDTYWRTIREASEEADNLATVLSEQAERYVQLIDLLLQDVQARALETGARTPDELRERFETRGGRLFIALLANNLPERHGIAVFDPDGNVISEGSGSTGFNIADRPYFPWLRDHGDAGLVVAEPAVNRATGAVLIFLARRLSAPDGRFLGAAVASVDVGYLSGLYHAISRKHRVAVTLLRRDGTVLARDPMEPWMPRAIPASSQWFAQVARNGGTYRGQSDFDARQAIISVHPLAAYPMVLNVSAGLGDVLATWRIEAAYTGLADVLLASLVLVLFLGIARHVDGQEQYGKALLAGAAALRGSEARLDRAQEIAGIGSWELDIATGQSVWSKNLYRIWGVADDFDLTAAALVRMCHPDGAAARDAWYADLCAGRVRGPIDIRIVRPDGETRTIQAEGRSIADPDGTVRRIAGTARDVSDLRMLERQLAQAQKMEAIGNLTGGIAHDFNNVLGIVIGNLDLLQPLIEARPDASELCAEALDGAIRCADLVQRLLAFARRQPLHPQVTDINALVRDIGHLLRRTLGEAIALTLDLEPDLWPAMVDPVQLQASLVNLATNARDAMPKGGQLQIATRNIMVTNRERARHPEAEPGAYAAITVRDTGQGIPADIAARIFEPFFSTKGPEKGTGLGLPMVFGFVQQSGGHLSVRSADGAGASFRLYLPRTDAGTVAAASGGATGTVPGGSESILVVEDNPAMRRAVVRQLGVLGYRVREAEHAEAAMEALRDRGAPNLLLTDLVLQGQGDGLDLAIAARQSWPGLKVLLMSGFPGVRDASRRLEECGLPMLDKPFFLDELAAAVRQALSADAVPGPAPFPPGRPESAARRTDCV